MFYDDLSKWLMGGRFLLVVLALFLCRPALAQNDNNDDDDDNPPPRGATTVQLPTFGVAIDAEGVLTTKLFAAADPQLLRQRLAAARRAQGGQLFAPAKLRKVSLVRLERELAAQLAAGKQPNDTLLHLAGLQRVRYVFFLPEQRDIVLAGPAEGWIADPAGRALGVTSGLPVLLLEDLAAALRAYPPGERQRAFVGCTIDPPRAGLARLQKFQSTIPRAIAAADRQRVAAEVQRGTMEALGLADVRVFGVPANTHLAQVMLEADYRMKLIGIGAEPPPIKMATFVSSIGVPKQMTLQRWWFTPEYRCLKISPDRNAVEFQGAGVQLQTEDKTVGPDGKLMDHTGPPSGASMAYTEAFTKNYDKIAAKNVVFAQLRTSIDLLVTAALLRHEDYYARADWKPGVLLDERMLAIETGVTPQQAPCVANTTWRGNRMISPAGGGVSILPDQALTDENLIADADGILSKVRDELKRPADDTNWWWD